MSVGSIKIAAYNHVYDTDENTPITWVLSEERKSNGWQWDRRLLTDTSQQKNQYPIAIQGFNAGLKDGFSQADWKSGVQQGITLNTVNFSIVNGDPAWIPEYDVGSYSVFWDKRLLYSDYSYMQNFNANHTDSLSSLAIHPDCKQDTISVAVYFRDEDGLVSTYKAFEHVDSFTGDLVDGERLSTENDAGFLTENISKRHNEYTIRNDLLILNSAYSQQVGIGNGLLDLEATWASYSVEAGGFIFLSYISPVDVTVKVVSPERVVTTLTEYSDLTYVKPETVGFSVDRDLGVIEVSGLTANPLVLLEPLSQIAEQIVCYPDTNFKSFPESGVVLLNDEYIAYSGKGARSLENCTRGFWDTMPAGHDVGTKVNFSPRGSFVSGTYYVSYNVLPRVDYEITNYAKRTANNADWLNVHNLAHMKSNKIIQLVSTTPSLDRIVLSTDETLIGGNLYGPVYFGTDVARIVATAYDAFDNPVEDIVITIEITSGPGLLNSAASTLSGESNSEGEFDCLYNAPYSDENATLAVTEITHVGDDTWMLVPDASTSIALSETVVYQILKHDPVLGTVGKHVQVIGTGDAVAPYGEGYIDCLCVYSSEFDGGTLQLLNDFVRYTFSVNKTFEIDHETYGKVTRFYVNESESILSENLTSGDVWLYSSEADEWDSEVKNGVNVLLYEFSNNYQHPLTGTTGAYGPLRPNSLESKQFKFYGRHLPIPEPENNSFNLGGYCIVGSTEARLVASATDPYTNTTVVSNEIRCKIILANSLTGVDASGVLSIPQGFTFGSEEFNIGAGLGGANFMTVNPKASGINQFTIKGSF